MKRTLSLILALLICLSLFSCGASNASADETPTPTPLPTDSPTPTAIPTSTATPAPTATTAPTATPVPVDPYGEQTDLMAIAMEEGKFSPLENLETRILGDGVFDDFKLLHQNPLTAAEYSLSFRALAEQIESHSVSLDEFAMQAVAQYGFDRNFEFLIDYPVYTDLTEALQVFYNACGSFEAVDTALLSKLDTAVQQALAKFISAAAYAVEMTKPSLDAFSPDEFDMLSAFRYTKVATTDYSDLTAANYCYSKADENMILIASITMLRASDELARALEHTSTLTKEDESLSVFTPLGNILLGTTGNDTYESPCTLLIIDPGGDDIYNGKIAASTSLTNPFSVVLDLFGNDVYDADDNDGATQGSGLLGAGILMDMSGDDTYKAYRLAQGSALVGVGVIYDASGNDSYSSCLSSQSSATFGLALAIDTAGDDSYSSIAFSQSYAGNRGVSLLVNSEGSDTYRVEPLVQEEFSDFSYELYTNVNGNWSQGCGAGNRSFRPTNSSGLAGGIAGLVDLGDGDDTYVGGIWVMGVGYWNGIGVLIDENGADFYESRHYCQASAAHWGVGTLIDMGNGDDTHTYRFEGPSISTSAGMAYVFDRGLALFVDEGGNDYYNGQHIGAGSAISAYDDKGFLKQDQIYSIFIDCDGDDTYGEFYQQALGYGRGGFFIDCNGNDKYVNKQKGSNDFLSVGLSENNTVRCGGLFFDYNHKEGRLARKVSFWEEAKEKFGM